MHRLVFRRTLKHRSLDEGRRGLEFYGLTHFPFPFRNTFFT
jgi:hypothetical protein